MKKNSWHYSLAKFGSIWFESECDNLTICRYGQFVLKGFFSILVQILAFGFIAVFFIGGIIPWIAFMVINGVLVRPDILASTNLVAILATLIGLVILTVVIWLETNFKMMCKNSRFFNKEKFCKTINFD